MLTLHGKTHRADIPIVRLFVSFDFSLHLLSQRRWEVFHGQFSESRWAPRTRNPRPEGSYTLENIRFVLDKSVVSKLEMDNRDAHSLKILAHVLAPSRSGICDELLALVNMDILRIDARNVPVLTDEWWTRADLLLLEEMHYNWGPTVDPDGKFGVHDTIRNLLHSKWRRMYHGWAMVDTPRDIVHEFEEYDSWREAFEDKQQAETNNAEGIGRFGI